jgi:hypothetical protein
VKLKSILSGLMVAASAVLVTVPSIANAWQVGDTTRTSGGRTCGGGVCVEVFTRVTVIAVDANGRITAVVATTEYEVTADNQPGRRNVNH